MCSLLWFRGTPLWRFLKTFTVLKQMKLFFFPKQDHAQHEGKAYPASLSQTHIGLKSWVDIFSPYYLCVSYSLDVAFPALLPFLWRRRINWITHSCTQVMGLMQHFFIDAVVPLRFFQSELYYLLGSHWTKLYLFVMNSVAFWQNFRVALL